MQSFRFNSAYAHWWRETQLNDLASALTGLADLQVAYTPHSTYNPATSDLSVSTFWDAVSGPEGLEAQKADIYLRAIGSHLFTDFVCIQRFLDALGRSSVAALHRQIFIVAEDKRLESCIVDQRRGTLKHFQTRHRLYLQFLLGNLNNRIRERRWGDVLFTKIYHLLMTDSISTFPEIEMLTRVPALEKASHVVQEFVSAVHTSTSTEDVVMCTNQLITSLRDVEFQWDTEYDLFGFDMPHRDFEEKNKHSDGTSSSTEAPQELKEAPSDDMEHRAEVDVWKQEQDSRAAGGFSMETDDSNASQAEGASARMGTDMPEEYIVRRGNASGGQQEDEGDVEERRSVEFAKESPADKENSHLLTKVVPRQSLDEQALRQVDEWREETTFYRARMLKLFDRLLQHAMRQKSQAVRHGRLDKRLTRLVTEDRPRLFYHKAEKDRPFDVAVQILIDCSGSMDQQLQALKPLLVLFHDVFRQAGIYHDICGFWEETLSESLTREGYPTTHLLHVVEWLDGFDPTVAAHISELAPQLDNRDGLAIRTVGKELMGRTERQKWLIVLSDGEPAAENYRDAVLDTKNAVRQLVVSGIQVIHVCIADEAQANEMETLKQMYGPGSIVVPNLEQLPATMDRVLTRVLQHGLI